MNPDQKRELLAIVIFAFTYLLISGQPAPHESRSLHPRSSRGASQILLSEGQGRWQVPTPSRSVHRDFKAKTAEE